MAYTYRDAITTINDYLQLKPEDITIIDNTKGRGFVHTLNDEPIVIFVYPISCKDNNRQNFFDTRDSGANERRAAWKYAQDNRYKYFCLGVNSEQERYRNYILSLECSEDRISSISFRSNGSGGTGTQVNIPADFIPSKAFERIITPYGFFISFIRKDNIKEYLRLYDNRPYLSGDTSSVAVENNTSKLHGENVLYYGVPGSGKSHAVDAVINNSKYERVVFHPDYTYSDFVGQIMPRLKKTEDNQDKLTYEFVPGPFTNALKAAINDENEMVYLVIEEINRGNAPAIFGDIFQLLDRKEDGEGKYYITNYDIATEIYGADHADHQIKMPSNLTILATMNTSDQNVFTLDTAFQRRWNMKYIANNVKDADHASSFIDDRNEITWGDFAFFVNNAIVEYNAEMSSTEDKQLGAYFVQKGDLNRAQFAEKALKYLWDDVYRMERYEFFDSRIKSIGDLIDTYKSADKEPLKRVMKADVYRRMMDMTANSPADAVDESEVFEAEQVSDN